MFELKEIWSKKGFDFRIVDENNFIAKRVKDSYFIGRNGTKYNTKYYKKTIDGWIYVLKGEQRKVLDLCTGLA